MTRSSLVLELEERTNFPTGILCPALSRAKGVLHSVPFYSLIYLINHFDELKAPFLVQMVGTVVLLGSACAGGINSEKRVDTPPRPRGQWNVNFR